MTVSAPGIPHVAYPVQITASGSATTTQGSLDEITSCIRMFLACPLGACPELPSFGYPDVTFQNAPPDLSRIIAAVQQAEPRATQAQIVQAVTDITGGTWQAQATIGVTGTAQ